ncbi:hypothetical protein D9O36_21160, partial [Zobellia amurskyensis]
MDEVIESEIKTQHNIAKYLEAVSGRVFSRRVLTFSKRDPFEIDSQSFKEYNLNDLCDLITDGAHASPEDCRE